MFSLEEINSLIFYQGDTDNYIINSADEENIFASSFFKTKQAYHVLNMLLYPGIDNEITRICNEKKKVPIELILYIDELLNVYRNIFSSMCKYSLLKCDQKTTYAFRKDRMQSFDFIDNGYMVSFSSCSLEDRCEEYFFKKDGILLLEFDISNEIPHVFLNDVIPNSLFEYQSEILLPPFITFEKTSLDLTEKEKCYRDINQLPPKAKFLIKIDGMLFNQDTYNITRNSDFSVERLLNGAARATDVLHKLECDSKITQGDKLFYCEWKKELQLFVYTMFKHIYNEKTYKNYLCD